MSRKIVIFFPTFLFLTLMAYCLPMIDQILSRAFTVDGKRHDRNLVFFSLSTCAMCEKGLKYLKERGYAYKVVYVDKLDVKEKDQLKEALSSKYGTRVVFPALSVGDSRIVLGFVAPAWAEALGEA